MFTPHTPPSRTLRALAVTAGATALVTLALPAASTAATPAASPATPQAELRLSIIPDEPSDSNPFASVTLTCAPDGGTHPDPAYACERLSNADGVFEDLEPTSLSCPANWDPVTITASGTWYGREVSFTDHHSNRMCAIFFTGEIFGF